MVWADIINLVLEIRRLQLKKVKEFRKPEGLESYEYVGFKLTSSLFTAPPHPVKPFLLPLVGILP